MLCLVQHVIFSQRTYKGILLDSASKQPVEFANIGIPGKGVGTVSNEKGEYEIMVPDSLSAESVKFSMIGYRSRTLKAAALEKQTAIYLAQSATTLNEVSVTSKKSKVKILGNNTRTNKVNAGFVKNNLGAELATKLNIKHPQTHIRKFMINISKNTLEKAPIFRLNLYNEDAEGRPGENILTHNIIIEPKEVKGFVEVDLTPYHIFTDKDVFISIEWIKDLGDAKGLYFSTKIGSPTYYRQTSQDQWRKIAGIGIGLHAEVAY